MTDIATVTRNAHATGFEAGSHITLQTVMAYLDSSGGSAFAAAISTASQDGTLERFRPGAVQPEPCKHENTRPAQTGDGTPLEFCLDCGTNRIVGRPPEPAKVEPAPFADQLSPTDLGPPKLDREQASQMGYTGNTCTCGSMMMVRNGTCEKCLTCGSTTGCS